MKTWKSAPAEAARAVTGHPPVRPPPDEDDAPVKEPPGEDAPPVEEPLDEPTDEKRRAARDRALNLLARREHSALELRDKLARRGVDAELIGRLLAELAAAGLQSDARFAEAYANARADKGYGPLRLRAELAQRGVAERIISATLDEFDELWPQALARLARKRFGLDPGAGGPVPERHEQARQTRFLRQRGFTLAQISALYRPARG